MGCRQQEEQVGGSSEPQNKETAHVGEGTQQCQALQRVGEGVPLTQPEGPRGRGFSRVVGAEAP